MEDVKICIVPKTVFSVMKKVNLWMNMQCFKISYKTINKQVSLGKSIHLHTSPLYTY